MSRKHNENVLPPAYEGVERHLMALFYSGVYVTNADIVKVGKLLGLDLPLKDRMALLKQIMYHAHENNMKSQMMQGFIQLLQERTKIYNDLAQNFPTAAPLIQQWIQKARSTIMLLQREMRSNPYE
ncbi:hypothetical protein RZR97_00170 [Hydrogenimonas thermophila]|uniref:hypothetical protein n=1 Tax=Hydrogenimonas thermophila TaxID=223786 RepID=UPI002936FE43|nr:hypothetical protein [Hydrogenimonas thermophila]WOE70016.1 hypothetical protein RZR91_00170 [Hydrogenimonas thermophila]WOE72533.1 hypothetical protein RZR97_00170 [Hydrogenimonas thermophila]